MNTTLWVVQVLLVLVFLVAGILQIRGSKEQLALRMAWVEDSSPRVLHFVAGAELLAAFVLILPVAARIPGWLVPLAAMGLAVVMFGALITHAKRREYLGLAIPGILLVLAVFLAYGRFALAPL